MPKKTGPAAAKPSQHKLKTSPQRKLKISFKKANSSTQTVGSDESRL
jgi:hypothetical protein